VNDEPTEQTLANKLREKRARILRDANRKARDVSAAIALLEASEAEQVILDALEVLAAE
jgi:hypothetical protein